MTRETHIEDALDREVIIGEKLKNGDFEGAEKFAQEIGLAWQKSESLAQIARALHRANKPEAVDRLWSDSIAVARLGEEDDSMQDSLDCSSVLWEIAEDIALTGDAERGLEIASAIKHQGKRHRALEGLKAIAAGGKGSFYKIHQKLPL